MTHSTSSLLLVSNLMSIASYIDYHVVYKVSQASAGDLWHTFLQQHKGP